MRQSVRDSFVAFSTRLEGSVPHLYADIKGLVTIAIGNLVDPVSTALNIPLRHSDGSLATREEVIAEWNRVKSDPRCATMGFRYAATLCRLHLDAEGIAQVVGGRLDLNDAILVKRFPSFEEWPAEAQLATMSMAWACGPMFSFPALAASLARRDFDAASSSCHIDDSHNAGVTPRNSSNRMLYKNASVVESQRLDPDVITWPMSVTTSRDAGAIVYAFPDPVDPPDDVA